MVLQFSNINYIQTLGTAMGTKMTPTYATLTLVYLEKKTYEIIGKKYDKENLPNHRKVIWMITSYSGKSYRETSTNYTT